VIFSDEKYVKLYSRDTLTWQTWPWEARALLSLLLRKVDGAGLLETGRMDPVQAVALQVALPIAVVEVGLPALLESGTVVQVQAGILVAKFVEAQEATKTEARKKKDQRERERDQRKAQPIESLEADVPQCPAVSRAVPLQPTTSPPPAQPSPPPTTTTTKSRQPKQPTLPGVPDAKPKVKVKSRQQVLYEDYLRQREGRLLELGVDVVPDLDEHDKPPSPAFINATIGKWLEYFADAKPVRTLEGFDAAETCVVLLFDEYLEESWPTKYASPYPFTVLASPRTHGKYLEAIAPRPTRPSEALQ